MIYEHGLRSELDLRMEITRRPLFRVDVSYGVRNIVVDATVLPLDVDAPFLQVLAWHRLLGS